MKKTVKPRPKRPAKKKDLRAEINVLALIEALEQHVLGAKKMKATQVRAALALLKKTLPDLTEASARGGVRTEKDSTHHEDALLELE
jgi:hypothetical protein